MWRLYKKNNGYWYARDRTGGHDQKISLHTKSKRRAQTLLDGLIDMQFGMDYQSQHRRTLGDLAAAYCDYKDMSGLSDKWARLIRATLHGPHFERLRGFDIGRITTGHIKDWQAGLRSGGLSPVSINRYTGILANLFTYALERELIWKRPTIPKLKEIHESRRFFTDSEVEQIFSITKELGYQPALFVRLGILAGLRLSEILSLRVVDVDWQHGQLLIRAHDTDDFQPKSRKERRIPIHDELTNYLEDCTNSYYFPSVNLRASAPYLKQGVGIWRRIEGALQFNPPATPHAMRHTFGTWLARTGRSLLEIQQLMGHHDSKTTQIYINMAGATGLSAAVQGLVLK